MLIQGVLLERLRPNRLSDRGLQQAFSLSQQAKNRRLPELKISS